MNQDEWGRIVRTWNKRRPKDRLLAALECKLKGHEIVACSVGPMCRRCFRYFEEEGMTAGPLPIIREGRASRLAAGEGGPAKESRR